MADSFGEGGGFWGNDKTKEEEIIPDEARKAKDDKENKVNRSAERIADIAAAKASQQH